MSRRLVSYPLVIAAIALALWVIFKAITALIFLAVVALVVFWLVGIADEIRQNGPLKHPGFPWTPVEGVSPGHREQDKRYGPLDNNRNPR